MELVLVLTILFVFFLDPNNKESFSIRYQFSLLLMEITTTKIKLFKKEAMQFSCRGFHVSSYFFFSNQIVFLMQQSTPNLKISTFVTINDIMHEMIYLCD